MTRDIVFRFAMRKEPSVLEPRDMVLLSAFDTRSKRNGYYRFDDQIKNPVILHMEDRLFNALGNLLVPDFYPIKASKADIWLVRSERANESQIFFITTDFQKFNRVSDNFPEKEYNWMSSELLHFTMKDGRENSAIIYKPENFDVTKKYPVIITYYEKMTDRLNTMITPELSQNHINIPWFVSRGYIVCAPDIFYSAGLPGESALDAVNALTDSLIKLPYIGAANMAVHGHSFGGFETNYIIAHTKRFKAAMSASAICDIVSDYNGVWADGISRQHSYELGQFSMRYTLWERTDLYIRNSTIFNVPDINTPLLMMNNRLDAAAKFDQAIEFFTALRRMGKEVWMLEYEGGRHSLVDPVHTLDYTKRLEDFFGHYLMGQPMPQWMMAKEE